MFYSELIFKQYMTDESVQLYDKIKETINCAICLDLPVDPIECQECTGTMCKKCLSVNDDHICALYRQATTFK